MPKPEKLPDTREDEPKFLSVVHAYPLNANWEVTQEVKTFSRWVSSCVGPEYVNALFWKPSSNRIILLEIKKQCPHFERILGEHRWSEFLVSPSAEEQGKTTGIFYSTYSDAGAVKKDGWKTIRVSDRWFGDWPDQTITNPYPPTYHCSPPTWDKTNKPLCRPLPTAWFPPPPQAAQLVPGSAAWLAAKNTPGPTLKVLNGAGAARARGGAVPPISTGGGKTPSSKSSASPRQARIPTPSLSTESPSSNRTQFPPGLSRQNTNQSTVSSNGIPISNAPRNAWGSPVTPASPASQPIFPPGLNLRQSAQSLAYDSNFSPPGLVRRTTTNNDEWGIPSVSGIYDDMYDKDSSLQSSVPHDLDTEQSDAAMVLNPWEHPSNDWPQQYPSSSDAGLTNLWAEEEVKEEPQVILCRAHGVTCKQGICREYSRQMKEIKKAEKDANSKESEDGWKKVQSPGSHNRNGRGKANSVGRRVPKKAADPWEGNEQSKSGSDRKPSVNAGTSGKKSSNGEDSSAVVSARSKGKQPIAAPATKKEKADPWGDNDDDDDEDDEELKVNGGSDSDDGNHIGRMRAYSSSSSNAESVAASTADGGWNAPSVGPW